MPLVNTKYFKVKYGFFRKGIKLKLEFLEDRINTSQVSDIYLKLFANLPTVLLNECFNPKNLPFKEEVKETEVGHLFEHILLEYMCIYKNKRYKNFSLEGRTYWKNFKGPANKFTVEIYCTLADFPIFVKSLNPSLLLMDTILNDKSSSLPAPVNPY